MDQVTEDTWGCESLQRLRRRQWLGGSLAILGGCSLTAVAEKLAAEGESPRDETRRSQPGPARAMIVLWMQGGPSQLETFDPHPGTKIGGDTKSIRTSLSQVEIGASLARTAEWMDRVTLVRSIIGQEGDHERATYQMKTGWRPDPTIIHPSLGAILCHQTEDHLDIPRHISILGNQWPARGGYLGGALDAFRIGDPKSRVPNLQTSTSRERISKRAASLKNVVEREFARHRFEELDQRKTQHESATEKALLMMESSQVAAFDVMQESEATRAGFGDSPFGRGCLAAVRLIECGVRCVEVELNGWDTHANNHELQMNQAAILDPALSSLLQLLADRDLLASTLVVCGGEFGRSPNINVLGGRDHWQHGFSWLLAGGPIRRGYVHGATPDEPPANKERLSDYVTQPVPVADLHATLLHSLGISYTKELITPIGRPLKLSQGEFVPELLAREFKPG